MTKVLTITTEQLAEKKAAAAVGGFIPEIRTKITKVKIGKGGCMDISYDKEVLILDENNEPFELQSSITEKGRYLPHPDFKHAISLLKPHLAIVCDLVEAKDKTLQDLCDNEETLEKVYVTGFVVDEEVGVTLEGYKVLPNGKVLPLGPPKTPYHDDYEYSAELEHLIVHSSNEAIHYLKGKYAPSAQTSMEFPDQEDEDLE